MEVRLWKLKVSNGQKRIEIIGKFLRKRKIGKIEILIYQEMEIDGVLWILSQRLWFLMQILPHTRYEFGKII